VSFRQEAQGPGGCPHQTTAPSWAGSSSSRRPAWRP